MNDSEDIRRCGLSGPASAWVDSQPGAWQNTAAFISRRLSRLTGTGITVACDRQSAYGIWVVLVSDATAAAR